MKERLWMTNVQCHYIRLNYLKLDLVCFRWTQIRLSHLELNYTVHSEVKFYKINRKNNRRLKLITFIQAFQ